MEPTDQEMYDQLLGYLAAEGAIEEDPGAGIVVLTEFDHGAVNPPLRLHLTPASFGQHLRDAATESASLYPDVPPVEAAWRLFTVHLDEAVKTARPGEIELVLRPGGVYPQRADGTRTPFAHEVEADTALNDSYERLIQHYANRGDLEIGIGSDVLTLHDLDGHTFTLPLRLRVSSKQLRQQVRLADDPETAWQRIVDQIDAYASTIDPRQSELELTLDGVVVRARPD